MNDTFIRLDCGVIYDDFIWGMGACSNDLYRINIENGQVEHVCTLSRLDNEEHLFNQIIEYKKKLVLIPGGSPFVACVDMKSKEISYFEDKSECCHWVKYSSSIIWDNHLYLFPGQESHIRKINLDTMFFSNIDIPVFSDRVGNVRFGRGAIQRNGEIFIPCIDNNKILNLKLLQDKCHWIDIGMDIPAKCMTDIGDRIYLLTEDNRLVQWNFKNSQIKELFAGDRDYISIVGHENYIWLVPYGRDEFERYDLKANELTQVEFPKYYRLDEKTLNGYRAKIPINRNFDQNDEFFCIAPRFSNTLIKIDLNDHIVKYIKLNANAETKDFIKIAPLKGLNLMLYEQEKLNLREFCTLVVNN